MLTPYLKDRSCPKCCGTDIHDHWMEAGDAGGYGSPGFKDSDIRDQERIDRHCRNCHYKWAERPASTEAKP